MPAAETKICLQVLLLRVNLIYFSFNFETDTKSIVQAHTVRTTHIDKNRHNRTFYNGVGGRTTGLLTLITGLM